MRRTLVRSFFSQHRTPVLPQAAVQFSGGAKIKVGYLLYRNMVVKHDPHPLEIEMSFLLDREHQRYARHESESATHFFGSRSQPLDAFNRHEPSEVCANFFGLDMYQDALKMTLGRFEPQKRVTPADLSNVLDEKLAEGPPQRRTLNRKFADFLFLIVRDAETGRWTLPQVERAEHETLRMTVDRAISSQHRGAVTAFTWSNAPQAVIKNPQEKLFIFSSMYVSGRPTFESVEPKLSDHAWVSRSELCQYDFADDNLASVLQDIAVEAVPEGK